MYNFAVKNNLHFIQHEKFIGGRFSILSKTGIIILKLLGLKKIDLANKFSNFILNKKKYKKFCLQVSEIFSFSSMPMHQCNKKALGTRCNSKASKHTSFS